MEWLIIIGLGAWLWMQSRTLKRLSEKLDRLERARAELGGVEAAPRAGTPAEAARASAAAAPSVTPAPKRSEPAPALTPEPELVLDQPLPPPSAAPVETPPPTTQQPRGRGFEQWLAENGLAWLGGGAVALGGIFLATFAAQSGWFTPIMRIIAALLAGAAMIGGSEWLRRGARARASSLVAALLAGAGAASLYAAVWAAHGLYHFLDWGGGALALAAVSALLLGLSFLHGQALGVLAIVAAFLAPLLTSAGAWPDAALTLYLLFVLGAGCASAALRGWSVAAGASLFGAYLWYSIALANDSHVRAMLLILGATLGACALAYAPKRDAETDDAHWNAARTLAPSLGVALSALLIVFDWAAIASGGAAKPMIAAPALAGMLLAGLSALMRRSGRIDAASAAGAIGAVAVGFFVFGLLRSFIAPLEFTFAAWAFAGAGATALSGLYANPSGKGRALLACAGAIGALALAWLGVVAGGPWHALASWGPLTLAAAGLWAAARDSESQIDAKQGDLAVNLWAGASALAFLLALSGMAAGAAQLFASDAISADMTQCVAAGLAALIFALAMHWRDWTAWRFATLSAAAGALMLALSPGVMGDALRSAPALVAALIAIAGAAALVFAASRSVRAKLRDSSEALGAAALLIALVGLYAGLRSFAAGGTGMTLDAFATMSATALMLIAAGYIVSPRAPGGGWIARWRGHALAAAGCVYALWGPGLIHNPWWGGASASLPGPMLINSLAIAFAAPAVLLGLSAMRFYPQARGLGRAYASAAGLFALLWAVLEIRRAFHGPHLFVGEVGLLEAHLYGVMLLALACAATWRGAQMQGDGFGADVAKAAAALAWTSAGASALIMLVARNPMFPWRGAVDSSALETAGASGMHAIAALLCAAMALLIRHDVTRRALAGAACVYGLWFGVLAIRWAHHQGAMDDGAALIGLEGLLQALWPIAFVSAGAWASRRSPKSDYAWWFSHGSWAALGFAGLGLWVLFPPWWGVLPGAFASVFSALIGLAIYAAAAWLSAHLHDWARPPGADAFKVAGVVAAAAHLFAGLTLGLRRAFHGADMATELDNAAIETWSYSAAWALFGAGAMGLGLMRKSHTLRWCGIGVLLATSAKVLLVDLAALDGMVRAASFLGVGLVLLGAALAYRWFTPR